MRSPLVQLLTARRFAPLFVTQFLGAFNDNLLKSALGILVTFRLAEQAGMNAATLAMIASALFIAPFFLFSGASGTLSDRFDKALIARWVKIAEIGIMALGAWGLWQRQRAGAARDALLPRHALHGVRADQVRTAAAAPGRARARRRQRADRGGHVPRDSGSARSSAAASRCFGNGPLIVGAFGVVGAIVGLAVRPSDSHRSAVLHGRGAACPSAPRHDRRRHARDEPAPAAAADSRHVLVLALRVHRRLGPAGVCEGRALRQRAGRDDDAGALCDRRRHRVDPRGEAAARRGQRPLRPMVGRGDGDLRDRPASGQRERAGDVSEPRQRHGVPGQTGQLAHHRRSDRHRDGRRSVHRAALRDSPARERAEPPVARHRRQQHHQRAVHDRGDRRRRSALAAPDDGRAVRAGRLHHVSGGGVLRMGRAAFALQGRDARRFCVCCIAWRSKASSTRARRCRTR